MNCRFDYFTTTTVLLTDVGLAQRGLDSNPIELGVRPRPCCQSNSIKQWQARHAEQSEFVNTETGESKKQSKQAAAG